jgi:Uma2 family endonuclease
MAIATQMSVEEYLRTSFDPDCEYVDGELLERNVGEKSHSKVQKRLLLWLGPREAEWGIFVAPEWRFKVTERHYRIPDVTIVAGPEPDEQVLETRPLVCIEILSPEDRMSRMQKKIADYLTYGVRYVWVLDPRTRQAFVYTDSTMYEVKDGVLRTENPTIEIPLDKIFDEISE